MRWTPWIHHWLIECEEEVGVNSFLRKWAWTQLQHGAAYCPFMQVQGEMSGVGCPGSVSQMNCRDGWMDWLLIDMNVKKNVVGVNSWGGGVERSGHGRAATLWRAPTHGFYCFSGLDKRPPNTPFPAKYIDPLIHSVGWGPGTFIMDWWSNGGLC